MAFCFLFCRCLFFSLRSAGWSFGLGAMRFISKMTHFTMLEANIHTQAHTREWTQTWINHIVTRYTIQYTYSPIQNNNSCHTHTHSTYLRIRLVGCSSKRNNSCFMIASNVQIENKKKCVVLRFSFFHSVIPFFSFSYSVFFFSFCIWMCMCVFAYK